MSAPAGPLADWILAWIEGQKAMLAQWNAARQPAGPGPQPSANPLASMFAAAQTAFGNPAASGSLAPGFPWATPLGDLPGVGPLREHQAVARDMAAALADFEQLSREMAVVLGRIHVDTLDLLARRVQERANEGRPVENTGALYDLWIECGEATYAKVAHGDAYCRLQADLCNAGVRVQKAQRQQTERWLKLLDLPTRAEVNTLNLRIRDRQRRLDAADAASRAAPAKPAARRAKAPAKRKSRPKA